MSRRRKQRALPPDTPPVDLRLLEPAFGGESMGHLPDGRVVFVPRTLPGETARVRLLEDRRDYARAELEDLLAPVAGRVEPPCPYYRAGCGGCAWQHADYPLQLRLKQRIVVDQLRRLGRFGDEAAERLVPPTIGMLDPWHYRNQARFTVGRKFGELCFTYRGSHRLLRIDHCWIVHPAINATLERLQGRLVTPGRIHQVSIRVGANTGQVLVSPALPSVPDVPTGQRFVEEEILGRRFRLQPPSFFQVNTRRELRPLPEAVRRAWLPVPADGLSMAEILALLVLDRLDPQPGDLVVDAYSGVGTFSLLVAPLVREVVGIEEARSAVQDALANTTPEDPNVRFVEAKTEAVLPDLDQRPEAVILDPARVGAHPAVLQALLRLRPERLVYVSCDPSTLARDLRILVDGGYTLHDLQPLDMFPHTYHVESVATLTS